MKYEIVGGPAYSTLKVFLDKGEQIAGESGAMMVIEGNAKVKTKGRGLFKALAGGEALFFNVFTAEADDTVVWFSPPIPGDIHHIELKGDGVIITDKCYLAHYGDLKQKVTWRGLKGVFGGGGLAWVKVSGNGSLWVNSNGSIIEQSVKPGQQLTIDNVHLVAMDETLEYKIRKFGGLKTMMFGGEGFVFDVKGDGRIYLQTRNPSIYYRKTRKSSFSIPFS